MRDNRPDRPEEKKEFKEAVIAIDRVTRVVKGGRRFRFRALVVIGDGKNRVGVGVSKGGDVQIAVQKAVDVAKKHLVTIAIENGTIPHDITTKHAGAQVMLRPAAHGTGMKAGGTVRQVLEVTGLENILSKSLGSNNKINVAYATIKALTSIVPSKDWVNAKERGVLPTKKKPQAASKKADIKKAEVETPKKPAKKPIAATKKASTKKAPEKK